MFIQYIVPYFYSINLRLDPLTQILKSVPLSPTLCLSLRGQPWPTAPAWKKVFNIHKKNAFNKIGKINHVYPPMCHCSSIHSSGEIIQTYFLHYNIKSSYKSYSISTSPIWPLHDCLYVVVFFIPFWYYLLKTVQNKFWKK